MMWLWTNGFPSMKSPYLLLLLDPGEGWVLHPDRALANVSFFPQDNKRTIPGR